MIKEQIDKETILETLRKANSELSLITLRYSVYANDYRFLHHLLMSVGYLRDSINALEKEIKDGK